MNDKDEALYAILESKYSRIISEISAMQICIRSQAVINDFLTFKSSKKL